MLKSPKKSPQKTLQSKSQKFDFLPLDLATHSIALGNALMILLVGCFA